MSDHDAEKAVTIERPKSVERADSSSCQSDQLRLRERQLYNTAFVMLASDLVQEVIDATDAETVATALEMMYSGKAPMVVDPSLFGLMKTVLVIEGKDTAKGCQELINSVSAKLAENKVKYYQRLAEGKVETPEMIQQLWHGYDERNGYGVMQCMLDDAVKKLTTPNPIMGLRAIACEAFGIDPHPKSLGIAKMGKYFNKHEFLADLIASDGNLMQAAVANHQDNELLRLDLLEKAQAEAERLQIEIDDTRVDYQNRTLEAAKAFERHDGCGEILDRIWVEGEDKLLVLSSKLEKVKIIVARNQTVSAQL